MYIPAPANRTVGTASTLGPQPQVHVGVAGMAATLQLLERSEEWLERHGHAPARIRDGIYRVAANANAATAMKKAAESGAVPHTTYLHGDDEEWDHVFG